MKIKRYTAPSMRAALALVRAEQGPDAVILSSRRSDEGIEVIAAVDYDEALFIDARRQSAAPVIAPPSRDASPAAATIAPSAPSAPSAPPARTAAPMKSAASPKPAAAPRAMPPQAAPRGALAADSGYGAMQRELMGLRRLLETGLAGMTWNDKRLREPLKATVLEQLTAMDIAPDVASSLAEFTPRRTSLEDPSHIPLALLAKHLPIINDPTCVGGGVVALVGPTGAGKTTTIAKLAARWCMLHGSQDLALVSTDGYRIGAREQLMTYARILGAPMHPANGAKELARVLERLKSKKLVLIDTAGMGPRDVRLTEQLAALKYGASRARVLLALPAQAEGQALDEIVSAFVRIKPLGCVLTKVDESASLGAVLSTVLRHQLKIAYVCNGQRIPEDLHASHLKRIWLVREALELARRSPPPRDESYFARNFGGVAAHA
ncbi:MAG TPA: flagellar biosynthesis protein FlhF [Steroidobacteraceae bacterium]|jgi:flagellar biosynthesis protein FlhF|nr:flagellar biosynthesis protein FlhF [Steroidobacteraceae bacterium]